MLEPVYFVCRKVSGIPQRGGHIEYDIGEFGKRLPQGFREVSRTRSTHKGLVLQRKKKLESRKSR